MIAQKHSRREARRATHENQERTFKALRRRLDEIWEIQRDQNKGLKKLDEPIFAGYKKFFVVRDDITRSPWGEEAAIALPYINRILYCRRKDFTAKDYKTKKWVEIAHNLKGIGKTKWENEKLDEVLPPKVKKHFHLGFPDPNDPEFYSGWGYSYGNRGKPYVYKWDKPWWFEETQSRYYFTHYRDADGVLESEKQRIENKLETANYWAKQGGHNRYDDWNRHPEQDPFDWHTWDRYLEGMVNRDEP